MTWLLVFASAVVLDVVWALYIRATAAKREYAAAGLSAFTILLGGFNVVQFVHDPANILPAMLGAALGTFATLRLAR